MNRCSHFLSWRGVLVGLALVLASLALTGRTVAAERPLTIVTTTAIIADPVRQIVGDRGAVHSLMGQGVDPHLYRPTRSDIARLAGADILFYNGLKLEPQMEESLDRLAAAGRPVIAVGERLDPALLLSPVEFAGHSDPHLWMDVALWRRATEAARDALIAFDPAGAETYAANAAAYLEKLTALDRFADRALASVPPSARVLVTAHDAFNYFGRAYGFEVIGIQGISTESEAGLRRIEELVDLLVERRIAAVFVETSVSDRNVRALIAGAAARGHRMSIGGALYSDAMGASGTYEGTYIGMIDHNVTTIAAALGGDVSRRGMTGQLAALAN